jgi:hypothetical protein
VMVRPSFVEGEKTQIVGDRVSQRMQKEKYLAFNNNTNSEVCIESYTNRIVHLTLAKL